MQVRSLLKLRPYQNIGDLSLNFNIPLPHTIINRANFQTLSNMSRGEQSRSGDLDRKLSPLEAITDQHLAET